MQRNARHAINKHIQTLFDKVGIHPDGPGEEAFWNAVDDIEDVNVTAAYELHKLADEWQNTSTAQRRGETL